MKDISFILSGRDDNYMGNFIERMAFAWKKNIDILEESNLDYEIIVVDFNPINNNFLFKNTELKNILSNKKVKNIIVDKSVLIKDNLPEHVFYEYYAKNIGGIRSTGKFLFMTNSDIIISKEICNFINIELNNNESDLYFYRLRYRQNIEIPGKNPGPLIDLHVSTNPDAEICGGYSGDATMFTKKSFINIATGYNEINTLHRTSSGQASMDGEILWNMVNGGMSMKLVDLIYEHVFHDRDGTKDGNYSVEKYVNRKNWGYKKSITKIINENTIMLMDELC